MKKHEKNRNEITLSEHEGHGDVMFWVELWALSRKLKFYSLRQDGWSSWGKKIRVEICKYIINNI